MESYHSLEPKYLAEESRIFSSFPSSWKFEEMEQAILGNSKEW